MTMTKAEEAQCSLRVILSEVETLMREMVDIVPIRAVEAAVKLGCVYGQLTQLQYEIDMIVDSQSVTLSSLPTRSYMPKV